MAFSPELAKFSITILEQFFLTVGKNNFQNKIPVLPSNGWRQKEPQQKILNASRNALAAYRRKTKTWETTAREITKLGSKRQIFTFLFLVHHYNLAMISTIAYTLVWTHFTDRNILDESYYLVKHCPDFPLWEYKIASFLKLNC